jgi:transposase
MSKDILSNQPKEFILGSKTTKSQGEPKEMTKMSHIDRIREMAGKRYSFKAIQEDVGVSYKTVKKYLAKQDFNEPLPIVSVRGKSKIHKYRDEINGIIAECRHNWHKQQITAKRIYSLLQERHPDLNISYETVHRYVRQYKTSLQNQQSGFEDLIWHPGEAQADFGEADFYNEAGVIERFHFLNLSFPHSNTTYTQIYKSENAECVCQGLKNIFEIMGKVPLVIVFDNATGIGNRISGILRESRLFTRFRLHYGFNARYCNPNSGHEKGSVENSIGYIRRNLFTPLIALPKDIETFNKEVLPGLCEKLKVGQNHYEKGTLISELFLQDKAAMYDLVPTEFVVKNIVKVKTDAYGKFYLQKHHWYSLGAHYSFCSILVETYAWVIRAYTETGEFIESFDRQYVSYCNTRNSSGCFCKISSWK